MGRYKTNSATLHVKSFTAVKRYKFVRNRPPYTNESRSVAYLVQRLLQCNVGRARRAQDLLLQTIRENRVALAVVAEPYRVPDAPNWIGDLDGLTAVAWTPALSSPGALLDRGNGYVAVEWNRIAVVGVYISPNSGVAAFEDLLDRAGDCVRRCFPRQVIVLGDFNAHSSQWGDARTDTRGRMLTEWAAVLGLLLANRGTASTCVAWRGSSVVDITWATAELYRRIRGWRVADRMETLSDHLYIMMEMELDRRQDANRSHRPPPPPPTPRWRLKERDKEMLRAAVTVSAWSWDARTTTTTITSVDEEAEELWEYMRAACDASMPRSEPGGRSDRCVYWWTPAIADLRASCVRARHSALYEAVPKNLRKLQVLSMLDESETDSYNCSENIWNTEITPREKRPLNVPNTTDSNDSEIEYDTAQRTILSNIIWTTEKFGLKIHDFAVRNSADVCETSDGQEDGLIE
ncbi:uncharacterized protein LOC122577087 [Bombus pyrosoma]|uniref:uncharacterized protein LOC122577087 n=1 Tax=Bombus pyrosoma TaxID=396416 RepID=UPI001CB997C7|nr:uncharacterized protein LOC122577087 [Bombus pyrosoma]